jgi:hypothetical protein
LDVSIEHRVARPLEAVEADLLAPDFAARLAARGHVVQRGTVLGIDDRGEVVVRRAHFVVGGAVHVGALGRFGSVGWRETVEWRRSEHRGEVSVVPDVPETLLRRIRCGGTYGLVPADAGAVLRRLFVQVDVDIPVLGREIETRVAALLRELFDDEAALLAEPRP